MAGQDNTHTIEPCIQHAWRALCLQLAGPLRDSVRRLRGTETDLPLLVLSPQADTLVPPHFHR